MIGGSARCKISTSFFFFAASPGVQNTTCSTDFEAAPVRSPTVMNTGFRRYFFARASTLGGIVALNMIVWRFTTSPDGILSMIWMI